jgi:hypothetical protein
MKKMPPKLFEMSEQGVSENEIQYIFDALIHAEDNGDRFVNVYRDGTDEPKFLFTNNQTEADQQLSRWRESVGKPSLGFFNSGETWEERPAGAGSAASQARRTAHAASIRSQRCRRAGR